MRLLEEWDRRSLFESVDESLAAILRNKSGEGISDSVLNSQLLGGQDSYNAFLSNRGNSHNSTSHVSNSHVSTSHSSNTSNKDNKDPRKRKIDDTTTTLPSNNNTAVNMSSHTTKHTRNNEPSASSGVISTSITTSEASSGSGTSFFIHDPLTFASGGSRQSNKLCCPFTDNCPFGDKCRCV